MKVDCPISTAIIQVKAKDREIIVSVGQDILHFLLVNADDFASAAVRSMSQSVRFRVNLARLAHLQSTRIMIIFLRGGLLQVAQEVPSSQTIERLADALDIALAPPLLEHLGLNFAAAFEVVRAPYAAHAMGDGERLRDHQQRHVAELAQGGDRDRDGRAEVSSAGAEVADHTIDKPNASV